MEVQLCTTCHQPVSVDEDGHPHCANEACPVFGQRLGDSEPIEP